MKVPEKEERSKNSPSTAYIRKIGFTFELLEDELVKYHLYIAMRLMKKSN